ncbi:hypothetical protein GN956_G48 [Arapaima gigas]
MSTFEQRANIRFCQLLGKSATETLQMLQQAHGEQALSRSVVFAWHRRFREGRESLGDDERSGRPVTTRTEENIRAVERLVRENGAQTVDSIAAQLNISHGSCHTILTRDLRRPQRLVPPQLPGEPVAGDDAGDGLLQRAVVGDETCSDNICMVCGDPFTEDHKIAINHLDISCHADCFKCAVCRTPTGDLSQGHGLL